jgi:hypothetical protein
MGLYAGLYAHRILTPMEEASIDDAVREVVGNILGLKEAVHRTEVSLHVGDLCRAHAIHLWILSNACIGRGRDGMDRYFLSHGQIGQLRDLCVLGLSNRALAGRLVPRYRDAAPDDELDDRYFRELEDMAALADRALKLPETEWDFEYVYSA